MMRSPFSALAAAAMLLAAQFRPSSKSIEEGYSRTPTRRSHAFKRTSGRGWKAMRQYEKRYGRNGGHTPGQPLV